METRSYSELERKIIQRMIQDQDKSLVCLSNLIQRNGVQDLLPKGFYIELSEKDNARMFTDSIDLKDAKELHLKAFKFVCTIVGLLRHLEEERLIVLADELRISRVGSNASDCLPTEVVFIPDNHKEPLYKYGRHSIFVTDSLVNLAKRGFKSSEQVRHEEELRGANRNFKLSILATVIALLGLAASVLTPLWESKEVLIQNKELGEFLSNPNLGKVSVSLENEKIKGDFSITELKGVDFNQLGHEKEIRELQQQLDELRTKFAEPALDHQSKPAPDN